jgi:hypothetical protein
MARLQSYAEVVGAEELTGPLNATGMSPGRPLREYVDLSRGTYVLDMPVPPVDRQRLHKVAELSGDASLQEIATAGTVSISLEHLRNHDTDKTRVRVGYKIDYSEDEVQELGIENIDPRS